MVKRIKSVRSARPNYRWDAWSDGGSYRAVMGKDFTCGVNSFRMAVYNAAKARGMKAHVSVKEGRVVEFQFVTAAAN